MCQICSPGSMPDISYNCVGTPGFNCTLSNCLKCSALNTCSECATGYQLQSSTCKKMACSITNCSICLNSTTCAVCANGYQLNGNLCSLKVYPCNITNCLSCTGPGQCNSCMQGY